ncbi:MAG: hypothetical protein ACK54X_23545 [Burkholderiales bacterium]
MEPLVAAHDPRVVGLAGRARELALGEASPAVGRDPRAQPRRAAVEAAPDDRDARTGARDVGVLGRGVRQRADLARRRAVGREPPVADRGNPVALADPDRVPAAVGGRRQARAVVRAGVDLPAVSARAHRRGRRRLDRPEPRERVVAHVALEHVAPHRGKPAVGRRRERDAAALAARVGELGVRREGPAAVARHGAVDRGARVVGAPPRGRRRRARGLGVALVDPQHVQPPLRVEGDRLESVGHHLPVAVHGERRAERAPAVLRAGHADLAGVGLRERPRPGEHDRPAIGTVGTVGTEGDLRARLAVGRRPLVADVGERARTPRAAEVGARLHEEPRALVEADDPQPAVGRERGRDRERGARRAAAAGAGASDGLVGGDDRGRPGEHERRKVGKDEAHHHLTSTPA